MKIETHNFKFATTNVPNMFEGFASAGACISPSCDENDKRGNFHVDLNGTLFLLPSEIAYSFNAWPECVRRLYKATMSLDRRQWSGFCGGFCGRCWPKNLYLLIEGC